MIAPPTAADVERARAESARVHDENTRLRAEAAALREEAAALRKEAAQLTAALSSRIIIEQAVGILAQKEHLTVAAAFTLLRDHCRDQQRKIHEVAAGIVDAQGRRAA